MDVEHKYEYSKNKIQAFLQNKLATIPLDKKADFVNFTNKIDFSNILITENKTGNSLILSIADYNVATPLNGKAALSIESASHSMTVLNKVVFDCNKSGNIITGTIVQIETTQSLDKTESDLTNILTSKSNNFSGSLATTSLESTLLFKVVYHNGTVRQIGSRQSRPKNLKEKSVDSKQHKANLNQVGCTDWYWVTTYHFADGSFFTEEIYLNTTCDESIAPNGEGGIFTITPCDKIKPLKNDTALIAKMKLLKDKVTDFSETGYLMRRNSPTTFDLLPTIPGSTGRIDIDVSSIAGTIDGVAHDHTTGLLSIFSGGDLQAISKLYDSSKINNLLNFSMTAITASQTAYVLTVTNITAFNTFRSTYLTSSIGMDLFENLYGAIYKISKTASSADNEKNFLKLMKDTNSGLQLTSVDFGTFTKWNIKSLDADNKIISVPCND